MRGLSRPSAGTIPKISFDNHLRERVQLTNIEHNLMSVVHAKAADANGENGEPILNDPYSQQLLDRCEFEYFDEPELAADPRWCRYVCGRARRLDEWCQDFLYAHAGEPVTVLHLACGLDMRYWRMDRRSNNGGSGDDTVRWIDIDQPMIVNLRQRLVDQPAGDYSLRNLAVGEPGWLSDIPTDRHTLIMAEGLFPYFTPDQASTMIRSLVDTFPSGELVFDVISSFLARFSSHARPFRGTNISLKWGVDDLGDLTEIHPKLRLKDSCQAAEWLGSEAMGKSQPPWFGPITTVLASLTSSYKNNGQIARMVF